MMTSRILVIGAGNPIPPFIARRLRALVTRGIRIVLVADSNQCLTESIFTDVIRVGGKGNLFRLLLRFVYLILHLRVFVKMLSLKSSLPLFSRAKWAIKFLPLAGAKRISLIHFQWIGQVPEFEWIKHFQPCPIMASVRGSQVTVYPVTRPGYRALIVKALQIADHIHCVSDAMARQSARLGGNPHKIFVNYNGLDCRKFSVVDRSLNSNTTFTLISVGSLMWRKGNLYQMQILKKLVDEGKDVQLILVGDGPDREGLLYSAQMLGLSDSVIFSGNVKEDELRYLFNQADVYISTSIAEGLANSVVEAAASGLAIVAFECEGMDEVVEHGVNGFLVPFGDVEGIVEKLTYFIENREDTQKMGKISRQRAVDRFDENYWVDLMIKKYQSIGGQD